MEDVIASLPYVECQGKKFARVSIYGRAAYLKALRERARAELVEDLKASGVTGQEALEELKKFRQIIFGSAAWINYVTAGETQGELIRDAAEKANPGQGQAVFDSLVYDADGMLELACGIAGLRLDPNPPTGETAESRASTTGGGTTDT